MEIKEKFEKFENEMKSFFKERDELIHGTVLALLSRNHIYVVGPPGTAKSMIVRYTSDCVKGANYWERLFTRYTVPDEVFGPVKLSKLKEDKFERKTETSLPNAHFAFIDEIFKANSSILNSLLTILNERLYHNDGKAINVPLETMMSASNELPEDREELGALWDRFLLKYRVKDVQGSKNFKSLMDTENPNIDVELSLDEIHKAQEEIKKVELSEEVLNMIVEIRNILKADGIIPSTRRFREAMSVVKAQAWFDGRQKAHVRDLQVLSHILWDDLDHIHIVREKIMDLVNPHERRAQVLIDGIRDAWKQVTKVPEDASDRELIQTASEALTKINKNIEKLRNEKEKMEEKGRNTDKIDSYIEEAMSISQDKIVGGIMNPT
ncbi:AAA family ATPase [Thioalkalivibrio sp.]|uniref:AAA family ATPase n=1 Tax=Thioalkalivibrio sp. TaxID=2093813 RepID=UPI0039751A74